MNDILTGQNIFSPLSVIVRLFFAIVSGMLVGIERELRYQPAGLRTHMVLSLGSCLIMILSLYIPMGFIEMNANIDPARLAAQVISGIGFLGAGAIFRYGFNVKGLTTAASIWTTSGIGLTFGAGFYFLGIISTISLIVILQLFDKIEDWFIEHRHLRNITVTYYSDLGFEVIIDTVRNYDLELKRVSITDNVENNTSEIVINCRVKEGFFVSELFESIKSLGKIKSLRID
ncbi:MAG: MgtC/SapB family protein [Spirochaetota bacterium]|nr:MgtC/SapB family protein [Spirochaetota bacterium]